MTERISKSAPANTARLKQKDKKITTIKEINAWVHKGNSDQSNRRTARNTGLLTENVTEERMLFAKQVELGRERYKFLTNHAYEKHKFIERQRRKQKRLYTSMIGPGKDLLFKKRSLTVHIPQVEEFSQSSGENDDDQNKDSKEGTDKATTSKDEVHLPNAFVTTPRRPKSMNRGIYLDSSKMANTRVEKLPLVSVKHDAETGPQTPKTRFVEKPNTPVNDRQGTPVTGRQASIANAVDMQNLATNLSLKWARKRKSIYARNKTYGEKFASSIDDPRYVALQESLIPLEQESRKLDDVSDIVRKHEILRRESKTLNSHNAKYNQQKFLAFLLQKELAIL